jgi:hypothetical protein
MVNSLKRAVSNPVQFIKGEWANRLVQVSVYAGLMFYIVANPTVFKWVEQFLPKSVTTGNQLILHSVLFAFLTYLGITMVFDPLLSKLDML